MLPFQAEKLIYGTEEGEQDAALVTLPCGLMGREPTAAAETTQPLGWAQEGRRWGNVARSQVQVS